MCGCGCVTRYACLAYLLANAMKQQVVEGPRIAQLRVEMKVRLKKKHRKNVLKYSDACGFQSHTHTHTHTHTHKHTHSRALQQ